MLNNVIEEEVKFEEPEDCEDGNGSDRASDLDLPVENKELGECKEDGDEFSLGMPKIDEAFEA